MGRFNDIITTIAARHLKMNKIHVSHFRRCFVVWLGVACGIPLRLLLLLVGHSAPKEAVMMSIVVRVYLCAYMFQARAREYYMFSFKFKIICARRAFFVLFVRYIKVSMVYRGICMYIYVVCVMSVCMHCLP